MKLPKIKIKQELEYSLVTDFNSKLDAQRELRRIRNENALFGKRRTFIFSSQSTKTVFAHGIYEQNIYAS
jgi:hypothetical protein